ncbi:MAG: ATP-binding protein [Myxococcota bacterium]
MNATPWQAPGRAAFVVALLGMVLTVAVSLYNLDLISRSADQVQRTDRALAALEQLIDDVTDAETGQRGYLLTGDSDYLEPYHTGASRARVGRDELLPALSEAGIPPDLPEVVGLFDLIDAKLVEMDNTIEVFDEGGGKAAMTVVATDVGLKLMGDIKNQRLRIRRMVVTRATESRARAASARQFAVASTLASGLLSTVLIAIVFLVLDRQQNLRRQALMRADAYSRHLTHLADVALQLNRVRDRDSLLGMVAAETRRLLSVEVAAAVVDRPEPASAVSVGTRSRALTTWRPHEQPLPVGVEAQESAGIASRSGESDIVSVLQTPAEIARANAVALTDRNGRVFGHLLAAEPFEVSADDSVQRLTLVQLGQLLSVAWDNVQLMEQLQAAAVEREHFMAMLGHELRNPLNAIAGASQVLARRVPEGDPMSEIVAMLDRQSGFMRRMVDDLLDVARLERGKFEIRHEPVDVADLAREVADDFGTGRPDGSLLRAQIPAVPLHVLGDPARLAQVLANLLDNAAKFGEGRPILLELERDGDSVVIRVTDEGRGIPRELLGAIFERYAQVRSASYSGLGLGLSLVRGVVEMHAGSISVASEGEGTGATFTVVLPWMEHAASTPVPVARAPRPRTIVVADDRADARLALSQLLEGDGHTVVVAEGGAEALVKIAEANPSVVFCDISMGDGPDGYEVARTLRADSRYAGLRLVALTGFGTHVARERSLEAGFDLHLTKPVDLEEIRLALQRFDATL